MTDLITRTDHDEWAELILNRPEKLNALTVAMFSELRDHIAAIKDDSSIRCVVLRGAGKCFSAGHDLADIGAGEVVPSRGWHSETLRQLEMLPQPVIAASTATATRVPSRSRSQPTSSSPATPPGSATPMRSGPSPPCGA